MNQTFFKSLPIACKIAAYASIASAVLCGHSRAQTIPNPSFEADSFSVAPGYIIDNTEITGWTTDYTGGTGLNPAGGENTFADNGTVPNGTNVAFISGGTTLATTITDLTPGTVYKVTLQANAQTAQTPILRVTVDGADILALNIYPVSTNAPYEYIAFEFTAASTTAELGLVNDGSFEQTLLVDNLTIAESSGKWAVEPWTDDSTSGVDNQFIYTHAYNFAETKDAIVNGVPFTAAPGLNPSVTNRFSTSHFPNQTADAANNITGGSAALAKNFLYSGANVASGDYEIINIEGLTPGVEYVATIYTVAWEDPTTSSRWATLSVGDDRLTFNQDQLGDNNGLRVSYRYTADTNGTATLRIAPVNPVNVSVHVYAFSNREAVSRNFAPTITVQPTSTTVAAGVPIDLIVNASGFPAPTFQWRFNGSNIPGATSGTNTIAAASIQNVGDYDVIISNSLGSVTSVVAHVIVGLPMENPSFEADSFELWPGYSGENPEHGTLPAGPNIPITGWTQSTLENSGINPISNGESPFADNGTIPNGKQVAFIQTIADMTNTLSQTATGLTVGTQYYVHYYENSRAGTPNGVLGFALGTTNSVPEHIVPSGSYREVFTDVFIADSTSLDLTFTKSSPGGADTTVLIDNVAIVPVAANTAPFITRNPAPVTSNVEESATLSAQIIGSLPLSYQWFRNGNPIAEGTNATLTLTNLELADAGDYSLQASNSAGSVTTTAGHLSVFRPIASLFNTGLDDTRAPLGDGEIDPHYELIVNPAVESTSALVEDSTVFPISDGPWLPDTELSKWIGPEFNTVATVVGAFTYRTTFTLTNSDLQSVSIKGQWSTDNAGQDILVNGVSTGNPQSPGFTGYTPFTITSTNATFVEGTNTIDFIVANLDAPGYTGLKVEFLESNALPPGSSTGANLQIARNGDSISISWTGIASGQKLQSAPTVLGPWSEVASPSNPYVTTATGTHMFFRVIQ